MQMGQTRKTEVKEKKASIIKAFGKTETNTGSTESQIALITHRINTLAPHFAKNAKDNHSKVGEGLWTSSEGSGARRPRRDTPYSCSLLSLDFRSGLENQ